MMDRSMHSVKNMELFIKLQLLIHQNLMELLNVKIELLKR